MSLPLTVDESCIFCKIVAGTVAAERVFEDEWVLAFPDLNPQAPTHLLVIPKEHLSSHADATVEHEMLLGRVLMAAANVARLQKLGGGYRLVVNAGADGGQTVGHLHVHVLGGRAMGWPPG